ncbi:hypothetical protein OJAV_G00014530 [Oryzias javanicus]|uniref:Uncharacterized protein n=1 Tax=Oryzias javanicus TaxID=123683 RepID=A0A3S2MV63_ORYJA|nr:hypothetical protein OJAV_G00014530 [Oryzias javanicus]
MNPAVCPSGVTSQKIYPLNSKPAVQELGKMQAQASLRGINLDLEMNPVVSPSGVTSQRIYLLNSKTGVQQRNKWTSRAQRLPVVRLSSSIKHSWTPYFWS